MSVDAVGCTGMSVDALECSLMSVDSVVAAGCSGMSDDYGPSCSVMSATASGCCAWFYGVNW